MIGPKWELVQKTEALEFGLLQAAFAELKERENLSSMEEFGQNLVHNLDSVFVDNYGRYVVFVEWGQPPDTSPIGYYVSQAWSGPTKMYKLERV